MRNDRRLRRLVVDERTAYLWNFRQKKGPDGVWRDIVTLHRDGDRTRIVFRAGGPGSGRYVSEGDIVLVVGPEGGVSPEELALFEEAGGKPYVLGRTVLRTSTAGTAATAVLLARTGRWS